MCWASNAQCTIVTRKGKNDCQAHHPLGVMTAPARLLAYTTPKLSWDWHWQQHTSSGHSDRDRDIVRSLRQGRGMQFQASMGEEGGRGGRAESCIGPAEQLCHLRQVCYRCYSQLIALTALARNIKNYSFSRQK